MALFQHGETIICSITIKDSEGTLTDPETSVKITILDSINGAGVDNQAMVNDSVGEYHYDYTPDSDSLTGKYRVRYVVIDGTRVTKATDSFEVEV